MHVLVTGGVGYVGSHIVRALLSAGHGVSIIDDLSSGHPETVPDAAALHVGRCGDHEALDAAAADTTPDAVMHMAAKCSVEESVTDPRGYYRANVRDSLDLLDWMVARGIPYIIHSSTCAVYGSPDESPIDESFCTRPLNPYGSSKLAVDLAIQAYEGAYDLRGTALRYFNAAGAHPDGTIGEDKKPASNLIPIVFDAALGMRDGISVYGDDYPTVDGTGVRDYIHVMDLAAAHIAALESLASGESGGIYNLGTGTGRSVLEVVEAARRVTGAEIPVRTAPRRAGDAIALVANPAHARDKLGWTAQRHDIDEILADAWTWRSAHPHGYRGVEAAP